MNFNFNDKDKKKKIKPGGFRGDFADMMKHREELMPEFEDAIEQQFDNYNGEMVAIVQVDEDENGKPTGSTMFIGGVASMESSLRMLKALDEARDAIAKQIGQGLAEDPEAIGELFGSLISEAVKKKQK